MIEKYSFGSITISEKRYTSDLKIINGQVYPDWWRKNGHSVDVEDVMDILGAESDYVVFGSGKFGMMKVSMGLKKELANRGIEVVVEPTSKAIETFNRMSAEGMKIAGGFHLTC